MPDPLAPADPGLLASLLDTVRLGGFGVRNVLTGNFEGAGRNAVDLLGRVADAPIPGDWIPDISRQQDRPEFRDVVDLGGDNLGTDILNFAGDVATDPLTYLPGAAVAKGLGAAGKAVDAGVKLLPKGGQEAIAKGGQRLRATFGAQRVAPGTAQAVAAKQATADLVGRAGSEGAVDALGGLTERELKALGEAGHNLRLDPLTDRPVGLIDDSETMTFDQRLGKLFQDDPSLDPERLLAAAPKFRETLRTQWDVAQQPASVPGGGVFFNRPMAGTPDPVMGGMASVPSQGVKDYFPRQFSGIKADGLDEITGLPKPIAERSEWRDRDILEYLTANPDVSLEFNAAKALAQRMSTQGELAGRAQVGQSLFDRARAGEVELPDELLEKFVNQSRPSTSVVGSGPVPDISRMLGGDASQTKPAAVGRTAAADPSGRPLVLLHGTDNPAVKFDKDIPTFFTTADDEVFASGRDQIRPHVVKANVFIENPLTPDIAKARLPEIAAAFDKFGVPPGNRKEILRGIANDSPEAWYYVPEEAKKAYQSLGYDGVNVNKNLTSGQWWIPFSGNQVRRVDETAKTSPELAGQAPDSMKLMGIGQQSGKSVVGKSTAPAAPGITDIERKQAKDWLLSQDFKLADPDLRSAAQAIAKQFPEEEATVLLNALNGLAPRGATTTALAKLNTYFKPYAVYGAVVPKIGSITRNMTGGLWQQLSNAEARGDLPRAIAQLVPNWLKAIDDGVEKLFGMRFSKNEFAEVDEAFKRSGGDPRRVLAAIKDPTMRAAVQKGVLGNNFVDTEQLIHSANKGGWKAFGKNLMDYPGAMFKGAEQRMRYGLFKSLIGKGKSEDEAAKIVSDTFYDYAVSSGENRTARSLIPFFQFTAKAIPQQAKFLAEKPIVTSALANLSGGSSGDPIPPWMEGKINIPIGQDEQGNQQYIANLGLPVEALGWLPNPSADIAQFGRQVQQGQGGSLQPLLKTGLAVATGEDPYFGTPYGGYSKVAGQDLGRPGAVINQLLGTGLPGASAISGLLGTGSKAIDDRTSLGEKAANLLTGVKVASVDPDMALRQKLQSHLESRPDIQQFRQFFQANPDDQTQELLKSLSEAKARIKAKQQAAVPVD